MLKRFVIGLVAVGMLPVTANAEKFVGRCKMGECIHYDFLETREALVWEEEVKGTLIEVDMNTAVSESQDQSGLDWDGPQTVLFYCSQVRPSIQVSDGTFWSLDLINFSGATEMATTLYLRACHPGQGLSAGDAGSLYKPTPEAQYANTDELLAP